jgi:hypothetical protein
MERIYRAFLFLRFSIGNRLDLHSKIDIIDIEKDKPIKLPSPGGRGFTLLDGTFFG